MKEYAILTFGPTQDSVIIRLHKLGLVEILRGKRYLDPITDNTMATMIYVKTIYPVAKILTFMFAYGCAADDFCKNNLRKFEVLAEKNKDVERLLSYARSVNGVFASE